MGKVTNFIVDRILANGAETPLPPAVPNASGESSSNKDAATSLRQLLKGLPFKRAMNVLESLGLAAGQISPKAARQAALENNQNFLGKVALDLVRRSPLAFDLDCKYPPEIHAFFHNNQLRVRLRHFMDPDYFKRLSVRQEPVLGFIGCSDSRFTIGKMLGAAEGELFVARNPANIVDTREASFNSYLDLAVNKFRIPHIAVCGHLGCGGVDLALSGSSDPWLKHVTFSYKEYQDELSGITDPLVLREVVGILHVQEQVRRLARSPIVQAAWDRGQELNLHGWTYGLNTGYLFDTGMKISNRDDLTRLKAQEPLFRARLRARYGKPLNPSQAAKIRA